MDDYLTIIFGELASFFDSYGLTIIIGILSSFVASLVFLFFLTRVKPNIIISKKIAKQTDSAHEVRYRIKIINKTPRYITNVNPQLHLVSLVATAGGMIKRSRRIPITPNEVVELSKFDTKDTNAEYAYRFIIDENIEELWEDDVHSFLRFRISANDSLSGFNKVFEREFHTKRNSIQEGEFEFGNSLEII